MFATETLRMFGTFDPALLDSPEFKEDSVREVIILPMLTRLGYQPSGRTRVVRSKPLVQPFIYVGTSKHPVTIIPDYTLFEGEKPVLVLDAKRPTEDVLSRPNVQQAYSYAIHPEVRCQHFALCNGRALAAFSIFQQEPLLVLRFEDFERKWDSIERHLAPRFLLDPGLRDFAPDFGFALSRMGLTTKTDIILPGARLGLFGRVSKKLITASSNVIFCETPHCVSFDFPPVLLKPILGGLPAPLRKVFLEALSRAPFQAHAELVVEVDIKARLGSETKGRDEMFIPLLVRNVLGARFNPDPVADDSGEMPPSLFRLRQAFEIVPAE